MSKEKNCCDICDDNCGPYSANGTEVMGAYQTPDVKWVCHTCAEILDDYAEDIKRATASAEKRMQKRVRRQVVTIFGNRISYRVKTVAMCARFQRFTESLRATVEALRDAVAGNR